MLTEDQITLRERVLKLELEHKHLGDDLAETREVLHKTNNAVMALTQKIDALTNQGKGVGYVVKGFLALGGFGWLAGVAAFLQTYFGTGPK